MILVIVGCCILLAATFDIVLTILTVGGGGPITSWVSERIWGGVLRIHQIKRSHRLLSVTGLLLLVGVAAVWFFLSWVGWILIFNATTSAVVNASTKQPANVWERLYFVGYTLSTLGMGDYQPQGKTWQIMTALASAYGFFITTLTLAYLLPVVSATSQKYSCARYIACLGGTSDKILTQAWNGSDFGQFDQHLITLSPMLTQLGENHLNYPILYYFHSIERNRALALSIVALDEALTLIKYGIPPSSQPDLAAVETLRRVIAGFLKTLHSVHIEPRTPAPPLPALELLKRAGIPTVSYKEFEQSTQQITRRRQLLLALVQNDGWVWDAIASSQTTSRASDLSDDTIVAQLTLH
ncbi:MAG: ion channel [Microcoleaceae cyanobacterium]